MAGCGSSDDAPAGAKTLSFELTDAGCIPHNAKAPAGPVTFEVENGGSANVTELEVLDGETILGEKENLTEGLTGSFSLTLEEGEYTLRCNGGSEEDGTLTVTGELDRPGRAPRSKRRSPSTASTSRRTPTELVATTKPFVAAVVAGNVAEAKSLYPAARIPYERIEPVAESFGDLDPRIDARENDVPTSEFGGFHRIEKALWEEDTTKGMAPVAEAAARRRRRTASRKSRPSTCRRCRSPTAPTSCSARSRPRRSPARRSATRTSTWSTSRPTSKAPRRPSKRSSRCSSKKDPKLAKEIEAQLRRRSTPR